MDSSTSSSPPISSTSTRAARRAGERDLVCGPTSRRTTRTVRRPAAARAQPPRPRPRCPSPRRRTTGRMPPDARGAGARRRTCTLATGRSPARCSMASTIDAAQTELVHVVLLLLLAATISTRTLTSGSTRSMRMRGGSMPKSRMSNVDSPVESRSCRRRRTRRACRPRSSFVTPRNVTLAADAVATVVVHGLHRPSARRRSCGYRRASMRRL